MTLTQNKERAQKRSLPKRTFIINGYLCHCILFMLRYKLKLKKQYNLNSGTTKSFSFVFFF